MSNDVRYEIGEEIARGDFATVFRGRDLRLDREVAIKQLHQQYLSNPQQTERYWQEAQILARLEHPHVMTIYDVVPERGWLILELMKGSLKDQLGERQITLQDLRLTILYASRALSFFQQHHILHGDVKPSNLLIDRNNVIKLGDFGIARRLQNDGGSAIKGTTRYIAPEVVSDKFGPVGPHSDIYSLGFSAYELLCGDRFESLFPGLHMFGRDQQLAWIMWHSAPDRRLPKIKDVLEGVPDQLAAVIEKMTNKDPAQRYRSADQIIADLNRDDVASIGGPSPEELEQMEREARQVRRKRYLAVGAFAISLSLCVAMLLPRGAEPPKPLPPAPTNGRIGMVDPDKNRIFLKSQDVITVNENDLILLDGAVTPLADLKPNDQLSIQYFDGPDGKTKRIRATRGESSLYVGKLVKIDFADKRLSIASEGDEDRKFLFDGETPISLNGDSAVVANLRVGDTIDVEYWTDDDGAHAVALDAKRQLKTSGVVDSFDIANRELTFAKGGTATTRKVADGCAITINGRDNLAGRNITLGDLESGDQIVSLTYDAQVLSIDLERDLSDIVEVWSVDAATNRLTVVVNGARVEVSAADAKIQYRDREVDLAFLRKGDRLVVAHESPDHRDLSATSIEVTDLVRDPRVVALVICQQSYDAIQITPYEFATRDAELVVEAFDTGARVPDVQRTLLKDLTREQLVLAINEFLTVQDKRAQLVVYFVGQAYVDLSTGVTYLAARDFRLEDMPGTGLTLRDLLTTIENFQAREKLLLLDTCHEVSAVESQSQPSTGDQVRGTMIGEAVSRSVIVIGSCDTERLVVVDDDKQQGQFGLDVAQAVDGKADYDGDQHVTADELYRYLQKQLMVVQQTPVRFQPDTRPPRLTPEAAEAVRDLLAEVSRIRISPDFEANFARALALCGDEPDASLAYAMVKLKSGRTGESIDVFRAVLGSHPKAWVAYHAAVYQHLAKKEWGTAGDLLARMVRQIATNPTSSSEYISHLLRFAGVTRGFLATVDSDPRNVQALDAAAEQLSAEQQAVYEEGRKEFATRYEQTPESQRGSARRFYKFDFELVKQYLLDELD
jgi:hypothetical protein